MPRRGTWEKRNAGFKARQAAKLASARTDVERLTAAFDWFRSSVSLLERRRVPPGYGQAENRRQAARARREVASHLVAWAQAIDRGQFDAGRT